MSDLPEKLIKARTVCLYRAPYFAALAFTLAYVKVDDPEVVDTMAVDDEGRLYFHPPFVEAKSVAHLATVLEHEYLHIVRKHHKRGENKNHEKWNLATDMEINDDLREAKRPYNWSELWTPEKMGLPNGRTAEQYYNAMRAPSGGGGGGKGNSPADLKRGSLPNAGPGPSPEDLQAAIEQVRAAAKKAGTSAGRAARGIVPEDEPQVDWRVVLRQAISLAVDVDYSIRKGCRRPLGSFVLPRIHTVLGARVGVVIDTSASMGDRELAQIGCEIVGVAREAGEVTLVIGDTRVEYAAVVRRFEDIRPHLAKAKGGGGTDLRPLIAEAAKHKPDVLVVATDAYTPWPDKPPAVPMIVLLSPTGSEELVPAWRRQVIKLPGRKE